VTTNDVVEAPEMIEHIGAGFVARPVDSFTDALGFSEKMNDSIAALSPPLPAPLIELVRPASG
jgi:hypothetical protein